MHSFVILERRTGPSDLPGRVQCGGHTLFLVTGRKKTENVLVNAIEKLIRNNNEMKVSGNRTIFKIASDHFDK